MTVKEIVDLVISARGLTQGRLADELGIARPTFNRYLNDDVLKFKYLSEILEKYNISLKIVDGISGKELEPNRMGRGKRVVQVVDGVTYDTGKAYAIANDFFADGKHEFSNGFARELYRMKDGTYFYAIYTEWNDKATIAPNVPEESALKFVKTYGTDLHIHSD